MQRSKALDKSNALNCYESTSEIVVLTKSSISHSETLKNIAIWKITDKDQFDI